MQWSRKEPFYNSNRVCWISNFQSKEPSDWIYAKICFLQEKSFYKQKNLNNWSDKQKIEKIRKVSYEFQKPVFCVLCTMKSLWTIEPTHLSWYMDQQYFLGHWKGVFKNIYCFFFSFNKYSDFLLLLHKNHWVTHLVTFIYVWEKTLEFMTRSWVYYHQVSESNINRSKIIALLNNTVMLDQWI